jgi:hypothetical protein
MKGILVTLQEITDSTITPERFVKTMQFVYDLQKIFTIADELKLDLAYYLRSLYYEEVHRGREIEKASSSFTSACL